MKPSYYFIPILIMAFVVAIAAPPAQAELVTITAILVAVFTSAVVTSEVIKSEPDAKMATGSDETGSIQQANSDLKNLEPAQ